MELSQEWGFPGALELWRGRGGTSRMQMCSGGGVASQARGQGGD